MAHLTIVTKRPSMIQWPMQRNVYTLVPSTNSVNKSISSNQPDTTCNTNTSRMFTATVCQPQSSSTGSNTYDDSLTNLSWLHDINILKRAIPVINSSNNHHSANDSASDKPKELSIVSTSNSICSSSVGTVYPNDIDDTNDFNINNDEQWRLYRTNPHAKPIYSYSQLILLAMRQSGHEKMTLQMIYEWVAENFPYFKKMEPTWQNSIRHNLSLNKCFIKVARTKKETSGKGGFWKLSPDYDRQRCQTSSSINSLPQYINPTPNKRSRPSKRSDHVKSLIKNSLPTSSMNHVIKSEAWIDPILPSIVSKTHSQLHCQTSILDPPSTYIRMPSSLLSPISSPDSLAVPPFYHQQQISDFSSVLTPSPSSPSSMSSAMAKQSFLPTKLDETDMLLLDAATFDWDAYLCETPNDIDVQPLLCTKTEQDLFNEFNAALTDLTSSAEAAAAAGSDSSAFDGFDYSIKPSTFHTLFEDEEQQSALTIKGRGIKRPAWWLTNDSLTVTRLPSLESAFDLKLSK